MNHQIKKITKLLKPNGQLVEKGYATRMHFVYNRKCVKPGPMPLKEWNFYQFHCGKYALQLTLGHLTYIGQMAVTLIDLETGEKWGYSTMQPLFVPELDLDPEKPSICEYKNDECHLRFTVKDSKRILALKGHSKEYDTIEVKLVVENDPANEKMVIATPFEKPTQFYLNYKENYYKADGTVRFGDKKVDFKDATGLLDWGRGVWPYSHEWYWGSLTSHIDGIPFGFNIGWGFGDTRNATENIYFYNKKGYKIGKLIGKWDDNDLMAVKHFHDKEDKFEFTFTPFYDNYTFNEFVVADTHCHQIFGHFSGTIETVDGAKKFKDVLGFIEHAVNRW
ncbi:MAG: DUF2804 domain-containing protein [Agathobacter sp.]|nr:DUF2804 domain-containing protein [Agathobacter sp.]